MDKTLTTLQQLSSLWQTKLKLGKTYNTPVSIGLDDAEYELLSCIEHDMKGTGSISHGYDHDNQDETKGTSLVQAKKCDKCDGKVHFFSEKCGCGSNKFKYINDSRWGIDANAHFTYGVKNYHLWVLYPKLYSHECRVFELKQYLIDGNNTAFKEILEVQMERGKNNHKNFLPFSGDFYVSNPKEVSSFTITFDETFGLYVRRNEAETILYDKNILKKMKKMLDSSFDNNKDTYLYEEIAPYINVKNKKTSHGKERGKTNRRTK
jgi:hypothetical protein